MLRAETVVLEVDLVIHAASIDLSVAGERHADDVEERRPSPDDSVLFIRLGSATESF